MLNADKKIDTSKKVELLTVSWDRLLSDRTVYRKVESTLLQIKYLTVHGEIQESASEFCDWNEQVSNLNFLLQVLYLINRERWNRLSNLRSLELETVFPEVLFDLTFNFSNFEIDLFVYQEWVKIYFLFNSMPRNSVM
ncbi:MAG TPA: hypothetical protein ENL02_00830 [Epsilonproteobacteria bacterium]|nr:hypothetical protein [Campylobacterota bacterium]